MQQDWFAQATWTAVWAPAPSLSSSSTILLIWFGRLYRTAQEKKLALMFIYLNEMESLECMFFHFLKIFQDKEKPAVFLEGQGFNLWLSEILPTAWRLLSLCVFAIIYLPVSHRMRISKPVTVGLDCGVREVDPIAYLEIFHLCRKGRAESNVDLCCCKPFCWLCFKSSCTPAAQLCWARGFITHCPAYQVHRFVSAWAAIIWHFIWKAFAVLSWQHSVIHIFFTAGIIWKSSTSGSFRSSI